MIRTIRIASLAISIAWLGFCLYMIGKYKARSLGWSWPPKSFAMLLNIVKGRSYANHTDR